jgi:hypothetical protein
MVQFKITDDLIAMLKLIHKYGSSCCVGACELRKPSELHCNNGSQLLRISSQGFKNRLQRLVMMELLDWQRVTRNDGKVMGLYTVSEEGLKVINGS